MFVHARQDRRAVVWLPVIQRYCALDHVGATVRDREVSDVQVDVSKESVVTLVRVLKRSTPRLELKRTYCLVQRSNPISSIRH